MSVMCQIMRGKCLLRAVYPDLDLRVKTKAKHPVNYPV